LAKAPLSLTDCPNSISVRGTAWTVQDEDELARLVGHVYLGHYRHVETILRQLRPEGRTVTGTAAEEAKRKLQVPTGAKPWHRDGLLFQAISWIAAHQASSDKKSVFSLPHLIPAHKGFDGLELELAENEDVRALVLFEDKATENPRKTITDEVWPELDGLHSGKRETELMQELTALLERAKVDDPDAVVEKTIWKQVRKFRVSITGKDGQDKQVDFEKLFSGYDTTTPGLDQSARRAEVFCRTDVRQWMDDFAKRVANAIDQEVSQENV
jgi:hypothetical protein